jgi:hypothetical protein
MGCVRDLLSSREPRGHLRARHEQARPGRANLLRPRCGNHPGIRHCILVAIVTLGDQRQCRDAYGRAIQRTAGSPTAVPTIAFTVWDGLAP